MSDDRTPPAPKPSEGSKPADKPATSGAPTQKSASPVTPSSQGAKGNPQATPAPAKPAATTSGSASKSSPTGSQQAAKPAPATPASSPASKPTANPATTSKPAAAAPKSATPLVRTGTGTAPQPAVSKAGAAAAGTSESGAGSQFRAQPKSASVSGPPTEAFDPIADDRRGSGAAAPSPSAAVRPVGPRRARLLVSRLDPWSVMKTAFMLAVSLAIVMLVATAVLWYALDATGVFEAIGKVVNDLAGSGSTNFNFASLVGFGRVMGVALVIAALEIVLTSALSTLFAFLYNLSVGLTGGVEVTLSEES